eukprot:CAMPEP_0185832356 /NCGR_PEP_ID=MMETSP1353-20130828/2036_1 /TAXON_ID=1077150 /ORGANISM="Erythrolobus australicus, Strain CCMP3124" /LENGTH=577 /DNA_ID=CAMNT_0028530523 /DNA_START=26 /DNA_END=1756 /DNA_ORIENTATION=-
MKLTYVALCAALAGVALAQSTCNCNSYDAVCKIVTPLAGSDARCDSVSNECSGCVCSPTGSRVCSSSSASFWEFADPNAVEGVCSLVTRQVATCPLSIAGTGVQSNARNMMASFQNRGWTITPLITVGVAEEELELQYRSIGVFDGIGIIPAAGRMVMAFVNNEISSSLGYPYSLASGAQLLGARVIKYMIDTVSRRVMSASVAYDAIYDADGALVTAASQINGVPGDMSGFDRFCSGGDVDAGTFGYVDNMYWTGEETNGGRFVALDVRNSDLYVAPMVGRAAFESASPIGGNAGTNKVGLIIGDDRGGAPLIMYIGEKNSSPAGPYNPPSFLARNGLGNGRLFVWVENGGRTSPEQLRGTGTVMNGRFVPIEHYNSATGMFLTQEEQDAAAAAVDAFQFSRPEDVHINPNDDTQVVLASTGRDSLFPSDSWGTVYLIDLDDASLAAAYNSNLNSMPEVVARLTILYDGDDADKQDFGLRSPDNLVWADNGKIYVQEDRSFGQFCTVSGQEASIWSIDPSTTPATAVREMQMDRSAVPAGQTDTDPTDCGNWESSGILDVSSYFGAPGETVLLLDV